MDDPDGNLAKFDAFIDKYKDDLKKLAGEKKMEILRRIMAMRNYDNVDVYELGLLLRPVRNSCEKNPSDHSTTVLATDNRLFDAGDEEPKSKLKRSVSKSERKQENSTKKEEKSEQGCGKRMRRDAGHAGDDHEATPRRKKTKEIIKKEDNEEINLAPLPEKFRRRIENMNGSNPVLVIQKELFKTDVSRQHGRLSMPESQIRKELFLSHEELELMASWNGSNPPEIKATLIGLSRQLECGVTLKKWNMTKKSGSVTSTYNLVSGWNSFVSANDLLQGMMVQVWAFRKESKLCFGLVKVGGDDENEEDE
ncbi:putative B3 domain-containing protein At3g24850 [Diospyros lotus]|uniref:putative B3 domain-containing protein At3g24850 n=1 Tax=Diospyros lotus TaxID=55363 RepID=UPI002254F902|nr:putative B3 domain-containing protein At3g24850 [Diospyros lotus]